MTAQSKYSRFLFNCDPVNTVRTTSQRWAYFTEGYDQASRAPSIACKFCGHLLQHPRAGVTKSAPTSTMKLHIEVKCLRSPRDTTKATATGPLSNFFQEAKKEYTQEEVTEQILKFFISGNIPFNQAENVEFQALIQMIRVANGPAKLPSRKTIRRRLHNHSIIAVKELRTTLQNHKGRVSLALDCWSSRNMIPFLCNTHPTSRTNRLFRVQLSGFVRDTWTSG